MYKLVHSQHLLTLYTTNEYHPLFLCIHYTGSDFQLVVNTTGIDIITAVFEPSNQTLSYAVNITEDNIFEPDEDIRFQLSLPTNSPAELGSIQMTTVTIQDNEGEFDRQM